MSPGPLSLYRASWPHALFPLKIVVVVFVGEGGLHRLADLPVARAEISARGPASLPI